MRMIVIKKITLSQRTFSLARLKPTPSATTRQRTPSATPARPVRKPESLRGHNKQVNRAVAISTPGRAVALETDPEIVAGYLDDAAHYPGGHAPALVRPRFADEVSWIVRQAESVLPVGAQSSLTGGATPAGDVVLSTERLRDLRVTSTRVIAGAGVTLHALQAALGARGLWFPPVPTYLGATVGGVIATNAAGAATFKYGPVRRWVSALSVVLANGDSLRIERGQVRARGRDFVIATSEGERRVRVPSIRMPDVPKCSAGYFAAPDMDLVDLFIGSEGTLGVIVEAELQHRPRPAGVCWLLIGLESEELAIALTGDLRDEPALDVAAIEHLDRRSIDLLKEDGADRRLGIDLPRDAGVVLLAQMELSAIETERGLADTRLERLADMLDKYGVMESAEIALPTDPRRAAALGELREAVPAGVNRRIAAAHAADARVHKTAADMVVPFERFAEMLAQCRRLADQLELDLAVWGHISDGNVHPNVIVRNYRDVERGRELILELARRVIALGGSPLAEHGVGRNAIKQRLLKMLYGADGVDEMRLVKLGFDPQWKLGPGLLFEKTTSLHAG
jgi:D-lactate dehydrogenase (cytochrome)